MLEWCPLQVSLCIQALNNRSCASSLRDVFDNRNDCYVQCLDAMGYRSLHMILKVPFRVPMAFMYIVAVIIIVVCVRMILVCM